MKTYSVAWCKSAPNGTHIEGFQGTIIKVGKHNFGTARGRDGQPLEWAFQDLTIRDNTGEIIVTLDKREPLSNEWQGAEVIFTGTETQHGLRGLIVEDTDERKKGDKVYPSIRRIRVTPTGNLEDLGGKPQQRPQERQQQPAQQREQGRQQERPQERPQQRQEPAQGRQTDAGAKPQPSKKEKADTAVKNYTRLVARISVLKQIAHRAALANADILFRNHGIRSEQGGIGAEGTSIFIESVRRLSDAGVNFMDLPYVLPPMEHPLRFDTLYDEKRPPFPKDKTPEEIKAMEAEARAKAAQERQQQASRPAPQPRQRQEPARNDWDGHHHNETDSDIPEYMRAMEDDDIPF